jgi:hypothetical protein
VNEPLIALLKEKIFHRISIDGVAFFGNCANAHFLGKIVLTDTPQVILELMTLVSSLYHVWRLRKSAVTHILSIIYID